jgi:hypothetical protein
MNNEIRLFLIAPLLLLGACQYQNEFSGTYNQLPAKMSAYSKNTEKFCIELNLKSSQESKQALISARSVFDERDFSRPVSFNTKNENCGSHLPEYIQGTRTTKVLQTRPHNRREMMGGNYCQWVTYQEYLYQDEIQMEFRNRLSDQTVGAFQGTGQMESYVDLSRVVAYGPMMPCYYGPGPFPGGPFPFPRRW